MHDLTNRTREEVYVVEVDGIRRSEHRNFVEALKHGLELKRKYPRSDVKLRDAHENTDHDGNTPPKRTCSVGRAVPVDEPSNRHNKDLLPG
jgi:hypothetical protein